jgi:hypothetical protein
MKRKQFLLLGVAGIAAVAIPSAWYYLSDADYDPVLARPEDLSLIWEDEAIRDLGKKYRSMPMGESRQRSLVSALEKVAGTNAKAAANALQQQIRKDFETGNTVLVDGWILSKTEARQCALFATTPSKK